MTPASLRPWHHRDVYELRNLSVPRKLLATALLTGGIALFALSWLAVITLVSWTSDIMLLTRWGDALAEVAERHHKLFVALFAMNVGAAVMLFLVSRNLFRRTAIRIRVRKAVGILAVLVLLVHASLWALVPSSQLARSLAGPMGAFTELVVLFCGLVPLWHIWIFKRWKQRLRRPHRVVIVGGGFSGLYVAMELDSALGHHAELEILLVDQNNYFLFPPLLPSAATGTVEPRQVTFPFRRILETTNIRFRKARVERVDTKEQLVFTSNPEPGRTSEPLRYDQLVLCPGSATQTFNTPGVEEHALFMRELADALAVRDRVIGCFEQAACRQLNDAQPALLRFVVVGAGPTGIEVATELHDLIYHVLLKRYPEVDASLVDIIVVQSGDQILPGWDATVVKLAQKQLGTLRIRQYLNTRVCAVEKDVVVLKAGDKTERLPAHTLIWCAGVQASPLLRSVGLPLDRSGRVTVAPDLRASGQDHVFVLGDAAYLVDERSGRALPPLGQVAFQQGSHTARNLVRMMQGQPTLPFRYFDFGALVSVGEHYAAVKLVGVRLSGFVGWLVWRTLYVMKLVGISNKIRILLDWTLDLLIERSITQIGYPTHAPDPTDDIAPAARQSPSGPKPPAV